MDRDERLYLSAAVFLLVSGVLHLGVTLLGGFSTFGLLLALVAPFYGLIALGLLRNWRWLAWLAFVLLLIGSVGAFTETAGPITGPAWIYWVILLANLGALVTLFTILWRPARQKS